jgi:hypothetical protein
MRLTIQFTGQLAQAAGVRKQVWEGEAGATLGQVISNLAAAKPSTLFSQLLIDDCGRPRPSLLVVLDGLQAPPGWESHGIDGLQSVTLMTPIAGG